MVRIVFLFVGVILIGAGVVVSQSTMGVRINHQVADAETASTVRYAVGGGVGGLGGIFVMAGLIGMARASRQKKQYQAIMQTGVDAEGTVTFVDKNYNLLVNQQPIYSIVEYTYLDRAGGQHTRRITNASSELVIRRQIHVGGKVAIKYAAENPADSLIVL